MGPVAERSMSAALGPRGFTLLELMLTMAMLALCAVPVMQLMAAGLSGDDASERQAVALVLAQEKMEEVRNAAWDDLSGYAAKREKLDEAFAAYEREVAVDDTDKGLRTVTVIVYWGFRGVEQSVSLVTLRTNFKP